MRAYGHLMNILTPRVTPFNVIQGHRNRHGLIGYLCFEITFHSNHMGLSQWHSIQRDGKLLIFFTDFRFRAWTV